MLCIKDYLLKECPSGKEAVWLLAGTSFSTPSCQPQAASGSLLSLALNVHGNRGGKSLTEVPETQS